MRTSFTLNLGIYVYIYNLKTNQSNTFSFKNNYL